MWPTKKTNSSQAHHYENCGVYFQGQELYSYNSRKDNTAIHYNMCTHFETKSLCIH